MFKSLTPILSILIAILLFFFFTSPQYSNVKEISAEIDQYQSTIAEYEQFNSQLNQLLETKRNMRNEDIVRIDRMVPDTADNARTLVDLKAMADRSRLLLGNVSAQTELVSITNVASEEGFSTSDSLVVSNISFDVIGTYDQFKGFLKELESSLMLMEITRMSLGVSTDVFQQYSLTIQTYSLAE